MPLDISGLNGLDITDLDVQEDKKTTSDVLSEVSDDKTVSVEEQLYPMAARNVYGDAEEVSDEMLREELSTSEKQGREKELKDQLFYSSILKRLSKYNKESLDALQTGQVDELNRALEQEEEANRVLRGEKALPDTLADEAIDYEVAEGNKGNLVQQVSFISDETTTSSDLVKQRNSVLAASKIKGQEIAKEFSEAWEEKPWTVATQGIIGAFGDIFNQPARRNEEVTGVSRTWTADYIRDYNDWLFSAKSGEEFNQRFEVIKNAFTDGTANENLVAQGLRGVRDLLQGDNDFMKFVFLTDVLHYGEDQRLFHYLDDGGSLLQIASLPFRLVRSLGKARKASKAAKTVVATTKNTQDLPKIIDKADMVIDAIQKGEKGLDTTTGESVAASVSGKIDVKSVLNGLDESTDMLLKGVSKESAPAMKQHVESLRAKVNEFINEKASKGDVITQIDKAQNKLKESIGEDAYDIITRIKSTGTLTVEEQKDAYARTAELFTQELDTLKQRVTKDLNTTVDITDYTMEQDDVSKIRRIDFLLGSTDQNGYSLPETANRSAKAMGLDDYDIVEKGGEWFIKASKEVSEEGFIRPYDIEPAVQKWEQGGISRLWSFFQGRKTFLDESFTKYIDRNVDVVNAIQKETQKLVGITNSLSKTEKEKLNSIIHKGVLERKWFDLDDLNTFGLSDKQIEGYLEYKRLSDFEYEVANGVKRADLVREGYKNLKIDSLLDKDGDEIGRFYGKVLASDEEIPGVNNRFIFDTSNGVVYRPGDMTQEKITQLRDRGHSIVKLAQATDRVGEGNVTYLIAKTDKLNVGAIPRRVIEYNEGGRLIPERGTKFIKQANVYKDDKTGLQYVRTDRTLRTTTNIKDGRKYVDEMNQALDVYNDWKVGKIDDVMATKKINSLTAEHERISDIYKFEEFLMANKIDPARKFEMLSHGEKTLESSTLRNQINVITDDEATIREYEDLYTGIALNGNMYIQRRAEALRDIKGKVLELASLDDAVNSNVNYIRNTIAYRDYFKTQTKKWLKTYSKYLENKTLLGKSMDDQLREAKFITTVDERTNSIIKVAKEQRNAILHFSNRPNPLQIRMRKYRTHIAEKLFPGGNSLSKFFRGMIAEANPVRAAKAFSYLTTMGVWNPKQLFRQGISYANVFAMEPKYASKAIFLSNQGFAGIKAMRRGDNELLDILAKKAQKFGLVDSPEEFLAYVDNLYKSEKWRTGNLSTQVDSDTVQQSAFIKMLKKHTYFYEEVEKTMSISGHAVAWLKEKELRGGWKGVSKLNDDEMLSFWSKADQYYQNMRKGSNSPAQDNMFTNAGMQFRGAVGRMSEAWMPVKLGGDDFFNPTTKARLFATQLAFYGAEGFLGGGRGHKISEGVSAIISDDPYEQTVSEYYMANGLSGASLSYLLGTITGKREYYNVGESTGPKLTDNLLTDVLDVLKGDENALMLAANVAYPKTQDLVESLGTALNMTLGTFINDRPIGEDYTRLVDSFVHVLKRNISTFNTGSKAAEIISSGIYRDSKGVPVATDLSPVDGIIYAITGAVPTRVSTYSKWNLKLYDKKRQIANTTTMITDLYGVHKQDLGEWNESVKGLITILRAEGVEEDVISQARVRAFQRLDGFNKNSKLQQDVLRTLGIEEAYKLNIDLTKQQEQGEE